jgi:hypothetical protein
MPQGFNESVPGSLASQGRAQPSQELYGVLSKAYSCGTQRRETAVVFDGGLLMGGDSLAPPPQFAFGTDAVVGFQLMFQSPQELMGNADEDGLHGFRGGSGRPRFGFSHLVFELIEDLFNCPAPAGQFGEHPGRQSHFIGDKDIVDTAYRIDKGYPAHARTGGAQSDFVAEHARIARVVPIPELATHRFESHVVLFPGEEVNSAALPSLPGREVDAGAVPDVKVLCDPLGRPGATPRGSAA